MSENSKSFEFEGGTVEEAIKKAAESLQIPRDSFEVKVVCEEKRGLFGMEGAKPAKVRITIK